MTEEMVPGEVHTADGTVPLNAGRETTAVTVGNTGDRPVQVGSHFHFFEVNAALAFDRRHAFGMRLNIPAGTAVRFEPGDEQTVELVAIGGKRVAHGMNGLVNGSVDGDPAQAVERARRNGFGGIRSLDDSETADGSGTDDETDATGDEEATDQ